ncbi:MAG: ABC transporter substrate-binding protein [Marinosulfonomonas sp.]
MSDELKYLSKRVAKGLMHRRAFMGRAAALGMTSTIATGLLTSAARAAGPIKGGTIKLGVQGGSTTDTLDPALTTNSTGTAVLRLWGEPLVELAPDGGLEPKVAESFEASPDAKVWTFTMRPGVTFSDGKACTAEDVVATLTRHAGEDSKSGALGLLRGIVKMTADGNKVVIELDGPNADLPYLLTDYHLMIQPNGGMDDPNAAIGTGPYILKAYEMGVQFSFEKNPNYWDPNLGHADSIEVIAINDDTARIAALQSGQVHIINRVPPKVAGLAGRAPGVEVRSKSGPGQYVFNMFANTAPFDNNDLRLALKYAMNREEMVEKILFGYGSIGNDTPINASYPLFSDDIPQYTYDPEKAAFHFKKSGHDGSILLRTSDNSFPGAPDASQLFQQSAKAAGIDIEVKREPNDGYWSEVWNAQPFCTSYWSGRPTQDAIFSTAFSSSADWNDTRFYHEDFDNMLVAARGELDEAKRKAIYRDMSLMIHEQGGQICPMFNDFVDATSDAVDGWEETKGLELMNQYAPSKMWLKA